MMRLKSGFTLVEVNLAIFIMAAGVLGMVSLYSLGFRESAQSRDDVAAAGYADAFFAPLVAGLSATNTQWSVWSGKGSNPSGDGDLVCDKVFPNDGWRAYVSPANGDDSDEFRVQQSCNSTADGVFNDSWARRNRLIREACRQRGRTITRLSRRDAAARFRSRSVRVVGAIS